MTATTLREHQLSLHGLHVRYVTSSPSLLSSAAPWFQRFPQAGPAGDAALTIRFEEVSGREAVPLSLSSSVRRLFSGTRPFMGSSMRALWQCEILQDGGRHVVDVQGQGVLVIEGDGGRADGYFFRPDTVHADRLESFFHYALAELLKRRNLFTLHAAALERRGRGLLIAGGNGCGKTTASLSLLRSGYRLLSDDHPVLRDDGAWPELLASPALIEVTDRTVELFPELRDAPSGLLRQGARKKSFHAEDIYPGSTGRPCEPVMILFPQIGKLPHSCLEPLAKSRALQGLLPPPSLVPDDELSRREVRALSNLVQRASCYRLHFGQDVPDLPKLITPLLDEA